MRNPSPGIEAAAIPFAGSCAFAKPAGELDSYTVRARITERATVFASAELGDNSHGFAGRRGANEIGEVGVGLIAHASGPIAIGRDSSRGYALLLADNAGRVCRGYITSTAATLDVPDAK